MSRLVVDDLHFSRDGAPILRGVALEHETGRVLTLLGPSGSGKTTLLWLLAGLLRPDSGRIDFGGDDVSKSIGFVFQDGGLWEHLTVRNHLDIVLRGRNLPRREREQRIARGLHETGLPGFAKRRPGELSGGERQRLALARALVIEPRWLFLDEPTSQLDGPNRQALIDVLDQRLGDHPAGVILATHQVDLAMRLSDRIGVLQDGRIAQLGSPVEVYERPANLAVARLLGPAFEMRTNGATRVMRPHQVRFEDDPSGPFTVRTSRFVGDHWEVELADGDAVAWIACDTPIADGARGRVVPIVSSSTQ
jgi:ABC-type Fe3+/spermidine/putrescine transport system ATPase subunit